MEFSSAAETKKNRISNAVAVSVVIFSAFLSVCKVKDDNIVQAMQQAKVNSVDSWSEYQAKKLKMHLAENSLHQAELLRDSLANGNVEGFNKEIQFQDSAIKKYQKDLDALQIKAKGFEATYDQLNFHDDQFDMSDALLSIALAVIAVSSLVNRWTLFYLGLFAGISGMVFGIAGFTGWNLHPDWLAAMLS